MTALQDIFENECLFNDNDDPTPITIANFPNICRICLVNGDNKPILGATIDEKPVYDLLQLYASTKVLYNDGLPQNICRNCMEDLRQVYSFVKKCKRSDVVLRYLFYSEEPPKVSVVNNNAHSCRVCKESFDSAQVLSEHCKVCNHQRPRQMKPCPVCGKLKASNKMNEHMRSHTKEKPYKCDVCEQAFSVSTNLKRHMLSHTGERPHVCEVCGKDFTRTESLQIHQKMHIKKERKTEDESYVCNDCGRNFKAVGRYENHLSRHCPNKPSAENGDYKCNECNRTYKTNAQLKAHLVMHGEKRFLCSYCGQGFIRKATLINHFKVHTGEKPYTCKLCNKSFAQIGGYQAHMLIHTGEKPYKCSVCLKGFKQLPHLKHHILTHTGERPHICPHCGKGFALKGNLTMHIRTHGYNGVYRSCPICGEQFYQVSQWKKHKRQCYENKEVESTSSLLAPVNDVDLDSQQPA